MHTDDGSIPERGPVAGYLTAELSFKEESLLIPSASRLSQIRIIYRTLTQGGCKIPASHSTGRRWMGHSKPKITPKRASLGSAFVAAYSVGPSFPLEDTLIKLIKIFGLLLKLLY